MSNRCFAECDVDKATVRWLVQLGWRGEKGAGKCKDVPGFCKSSTLEEIRAHGYVLTSWRYVGAEELDDDNEPFEKRMPRLVATLLSQFGESPKLEAAVRKVLVGLGNGD